MKTNHLLLRNQSQIKRGTRAHNPSSSLFPQYRFKTINVIRRREQETIIRNLGGDEVICTADEDLRTRLQELTAGKGVERAIDCVAGELGAEIARNLAPSGTMLCMEPLPVIGRRTPRNSRCRSSLRV